MKLRLSNYDKIIFDLDGVITSELIYWYAAALCAHDLLTSHEHYGVCGIDREWLRKQYKEVYNTVLLGGRTVKAVKRLGVNTNWDLAYVVFCVSKYLNPELDSLDAMHFQSVCMFIENIDLNAPELYDALSGLAEQSCGCSEGAFSRNGDFFHKEVCDCFDLWYNGSDEFSGLKVDENLLFDDNELSKMLMHLSNNGLILGIGTGRPKLEADIPLENHGILKYFNLDYTCYYDDVNRAEKELNPKMPLAKPEPYVFVKAALGKNSSDRDVLEKNYDKEKIGRVLVVGDAASDILSAKAAGFDFLGVLTGVEGDGMREYFEKNNADYIFDTVLNFSECEV